MNSKFPLLLSLVRQALPQFSFHGRIFPSQQLLRGFLPFQQTDYRVNIFSLTCPRWYVAWPAHPGMRLLGCGEKNKFYMLFQHIIALTNNYYRGTFILTFNGICINLGRIKKFIGFFQLIKLFTNIWKNKTRLTQRWSGRSKPRFRSWNFSM